MTARHEIKRRKFLLTSTAATGLFSVLGGPQNSNGLGGEPSGQTTQQSSQAAEKVLSEMEAKGGNLLNVARKDGQFLNLLIKAIRARSVLEIGTSHGYSAIWIGLGLEETGGKMTTIEILSERVELAKQHEAQAGLSPRVTFLEGDAHKIVPTLEGPFDFVFFDADKDGQIDYFEKLYPKKLLPGGVIVAHNAIQRAPAMKKYLDLIGQHPEFDSVIVSLTADDGFSVSYRHRVAAP